MIKKIAIMQPYFLPYIGYFQLMEKVDTWVIFDNIQYIDKGWINRNKILHQDKKKIWQYITVPILKRKQFSKITEIKISNTNDWKKEILGKFSHYKNKALYYYEAKTLLEEILCFKSQNLNLFLFNSLKIIKFFLDIKCDMILQSLTPKIIFDPQKKFKPGEWALEIASTMKAETYVNPIGGMELFKADQFKKKKIDLEFFSSANNEYNTKNKNYVYGLSIIDVIAFYGREETKEILKLGHIKKLET